MLWRKDVVSVDIKQATLSKEFTEYIILLSYILLRFNLYFIPCMIGVLAKIYLKQYKYQIAHNKNRKKKKISVKLTNAVVFSLVPSIIITAIDFSFADNATTDMRSIMILFSVLIGMIAEELSYYVMSAIHWLKAAQIFFKVLSKQLKGIFSDDEFKDAVEDLMKHLPEEEQEEIEKQKLGKPSDASKNNNDPHDE